MTMMSLATLRLDTGGSLFLSRNVALLNSLYDRTYRVKSIDKFVDIFQNTKSPYIHATIYTEMVIEAKASRT